MSCKLIVMILGFTMLALQIELGTALIRTRLNATSNDEQYPATPTKRNR